MQKLIEPLGVTTVDAREIRKVHPVRALDGWELKSFAMLNSRFREVLLLDADNVPVVDPTFLFHIPEYRSCGAVLWPDYTRLAPSREAWALTGVDYRDEPEIESGQILLDKERSWKPLNLAMWMNEHSDFWYDHVHGDKETFHLAWRKLAAPYSMPPRGIDELYSVMCQHDFAGRRIFQHRNLSKWALSHQERIPGFRFEDECLEFVSQLRCRWDPLTDFLTPLTTDEREQMNQLVGRRFEYVRVGYDRRQLVLDRKGLIGEGGADCEGFWWISDPELVIAGDDLSVTCRLREDGDGVWRGRWVAFEQMPVELIPL